MHSDSTSSLPGERSKSSDGQIDFESDRFRVIKSLGAGAMGSVCLAEDTELHRRVAIKSVKQELSRDSEFRKRIERECLLHAKVGPHPHIVTLFDRFESSGQIHLVMEFVEGETLQFLLERNAEEGIVLPVGKALQIGLQCLEALSRIHALEIIHRDIKPSNIMITHSETGEVSAKLMDFGVARSTDDEEQLSRLTTTDSGGPGTPLYMAPEQIDSKTFGEISPATDVYSMGILLFQLFSGAPPFRGTLTEVLNAHVNIPAPRLDAVAPGRIPAVLADVLQQALAKRPKNRYESVKAFHAELMRAQAQLTHPGSVASSEWTIPMVTESSSRVRPRRLAEAETRLTGTSVVRMLVRRKRNIVTLVVGLVAFIVLATVTYALLLSAFHSDSEPTAEVQRGPIGTQVAPPNAPVLSASGAVSAGESGPKLASTDATTLRIPRAVEPAPQWYIQLVRMDWQTEPETVVSAPEYVGNDLLTPTDASTPESITDTVDGAVQTARAIAEDTASSDLVGREHVVQPGDSLSKIASLYGVTVRDLQWWNGMRDANTLSVGQSLKLYGTDGLPPREDFFAQVSQGTSGLTEDPATASNPEQAPIMADSSGASSSRPATDEPEETNNPIKKLWRKLRGK